jgi:hypothetical protein
MDLDSLKGFSRSEMPIESESARLIRLASTYSMTRRITWSQ